MLHVFECAHIDDVVDREVTAAHLLHLLHRFGDRFNPAIAKDQVSEEKGFEVLRLSEIGEVLGDTTRFENQLFGCKFVCHSSYEST